MPLFAMVARITAFLILLAGVHAGTKRFCPPQGGAYAVCASNTVYIIDTTVYMHPTNVSTEFDWLRNNIIPGTAWSTNQNLAFMSYGTGNAQVNPLTGNREQACTMLDTLQDSYDSQGSSPAATLKQALQIFSIVYQQSVVVLFSASTDQNDIQDAGNFVKSNLQDSHFTVIAMNGANFDDFPARVIYDVQDLAYPPPNLPSCIIKQACDTTLTCDIFGSTDAPVTFTTAPPTSTVAPTTKTTTKKITAAPPTPAPTTPPPVGPISTKAPSLGPQCGCDWTKSWNDVIFVIDASEAASAKGTDEMWGAAQTMLDWFTVKKVGYTASNYTTRVGVITYGNSANVIIPLGTADNDDIDNLYPLPYNGDKNTNLESGIQAAVKEFDGPNHRANSKKVIVILASTYNPGGVNAPQQAAETFRENGGVIIVYDYVQKHGDESPTLQEIASPGYFLTTLANGDQDVQNAICDANCFCPDNYASFTKSARGTPSAGCYSTSEIQNNQKIASNKCKQFNSGFLAYSESPDKTAFLQNQFISKSSAFYIGATFDIIDQQWEWSDGTPLTYAPWYNGQVPNGQNGITCVTVTPQLQFMAVDCRYGYIYPCEAPACDSLHYCP